ncbi:MAG: DMT family transporter [Ktedonobacterales bacterium]
MKLALSEAASVVSASRLGIYLALALGIICIALSAIFTRVAGVPGTVSAFYRVAIAAIALGLPFVRQAARRSYVPSMRVWGLAAVSGIFFATDLALWNTSLFQTSAANATLLANDAPILVGLGSLFFFHAKLRVPYWAGLVIGLLGMSIIVGGDIFSGSHTGAGDLLALTAGVAYAGYLLLMQRVRVHLDTLSSLWVPVMTGTLLLLALNLAMHQTLWGFSPHTYLALLGLGLISQVVGWLAINYALGHLPAALVSATLLGQPVLTAAFAVPFLGEALGPRQLLGGLIALFGIYLANRGFARS